MYLALVFAVDLIEKFKSQDLFAEHDLIAVLEGLIGDRLSVDKGSVSRIKIGQNKLGSAAFCTFDCADTGVKAGDFAVVNADVRFDCAAQINLFPFNGYRDGYQVTVEENERRTNIEVLSG